MRLTNDTVNLLLCLLLSALGFLVDQVFSISIIGDTRLVFGAFFAFFAVLVLPKRYLAIVTLSVLTSYFILEQLTILLILFAFEIIVVTFLKKRGMFIFISSMFFWLLGGIPLMLIVMTLSDNSLQGVGQIITLQSAFNSILCASLAFTVYSLLPRAWFRGETSEQYRLSSNIFAICSSTLMVPLLVGSFAFIAKQVSQYENATIEKLNSKSQFFGQLSSHFLTEHIKAVEDVAQLSSLSNDTKLRENFLIATQHRYPSFFSMAYTSENGDLLFFAPLTVNERIQKIPKEQRTTIDREYYQQTKQHLKTFVANASISRGIKVSPAIMISAPIIYNQQFDGIVFGSLSLEDLSQFSDEINNAAQNSIIVITDPSNQIVFSNIPDTLTLMTEFVKKPQKSQIAPNMPLLKIGQHDYSYKQIETPQKWQVYVLESSSIFVNLIRDQFLLIGLGLLIAFGLFLIFAYQLSHKITAPLENILRNDSSVDKEELVEAGISREFAAVAQKLEQSSSIVQNFEDQLKSQVEEKTEQLEQLNIQLAAQAREDGLTGLLNRSGFEELAVSALSANKRSKQAYSVALIDIDLFKNINDNYGHLMGDACLISFADVLTQNCKRDTDIIGRYGGEEFIIFMSGGDIENHQKIISDIHQQTRYLSVEDGESPTHIRFTVSAGICSVTSASDLQLRELIQIADEELYKCKNQGRDQISARNLS